MKVSENEVLISRLQNIYMLILILSSLETASDPRYLLMNGKQVTCSPCMEMSVAARGTRGLRSETNSLRKTNINSSQEQLDICNPPA